MNLCDQVDEFDKVGLLKVLGENVAGVPLTMKSFQNVEYGFILLFGQYVDRVLRFPEYV